MKEHKALLPYKYYYIPFLGIAFSGFFVSIYLAVSHYRVHADLSYSSFCALSRALNCDTVSASPYSVFLNIPVAIWGVIGYGFILFLLGLAAMPNAQKKRLWPLLFWASFIFSTYSLILAWISSFWIQSYCIMCIITYLVNFFLLYYAWFVNRRFGNTNLFRGIVEDFQFLWCERKIFLPVITVFLVLIGGLMTGLSPYWQMSPPAHSGVIKRGVTDDGHPWIGAEEPEIVIEEFTDYLCTQCRIKHFFLRRLVVENSDKIRLVHRHFPMDHQFNPLVQEPYHQGSGMLALFSIYAKTENKFWETNDMFFQIDRSIGEVSTKSIAEGLGLNHHDLVQAINDRRTLYSLQKDIRRGLELGLTGTPGYLINNEVYQGYIPSRLLKPFIK